jgi:fibronectin-binding autotransporter adhesin
VKSAIRTQALGVSRKRRLLQCGTALPLLLAAWPALAQPIVEQTATDIAVDADSATGTPMAIDLRSTGGSITAQVDTVTATATAGQRNNLTNFDTADGAISASLGAVTLTGSGELLGVRAVSQGGDIDVHVGEMTLDGAITSGVQAISVDGDVTVRGDNVLLRGTGADTVNGFFPEGLLARSNNGSATVVAGSVETLGQSGSAVVAVAGDAASVTVAHATAHSNGAVTVYASSAGNATVDAGIVSMRGVGAGIQAFSTGGTVTVEADSVDSRGGGVFGRGVTGVSLAAGTVDAVDYGLSGRSDTGGAVNLSADSVTVSGGTTIGLLARTTGDVTIDAGSVTVTGPGVFPGTRPDGYRFDQGGIVVLGEGGNGTIAIDAGTVAVAGDHRYGVTARGNGAISIAADTVTLASADSVAVVARGGAGDVSLTTGTVTTTGASGAGVFASTTTGDITIDAGTTRVENTGFVGNFTGDAVVASSTSGTISITSESAYSAALYGTAVAGFSDGDVSIDSGRAETTGDGGVAVYGNSGLGDVTISADEIVTSGAGTQAVVAESHGGRLDLDIGSITVTGTNSEGIVARVGAGGATIDLDSATTTGRAVLLLAQAVPVGNATINITGDVTSSQGRAIDIQTTSQTSAPNTLWTTVNVAANASLSGTNGIGLYASVNNGQALPAFLRAGLVAINNDGTITGTSGVALELAQTNLSLTNRGTIDGNVNAGGGVLQNRGGTIDGDVTLFSQAGNPLGMFAYEGASNGVTGTITGGAGLDTYAQIFTADGTAVIGGGLPTAFDRYGVVTDSAEVTVVVETAANPIGATPALMLFGEGKIVNRADLSANVITGAPGTAPQVIPALYSYGFAPVATPFGIRFTFEGAGNGPASVTNEADITGRIALTTSEFVNSGSITRSSAGVPSAITARSGHAFSFVNTGTIGMTDGGDRVIGPLGGNPFNDFNPYHLPETALVIRSAVAGSLDAAGLYVPVEIANSGEIDGGLLVRMTASTFAFDNSGTISGFNGASRSEPGLVIGLGRNWDTGVGTQQNFEPPATLPTELATFANSGEIHDGVQAHFIADAVEFGNEGLIAGNATNPGALFLEQSLEQDGVDATSFSFVNTGTFEGNVALELEAVTTTIENGGTIRGHEYLPSTATFPEIMFGGETALEIDSETNGDGTLSFVNTGDIVMTGHAGTGVMIEVEAGDDDPDLGGEPVIGNATVAVVNSGTISATGGATVVPQQVAQWLQPGQVLVNPIAALAVDATDVNGESVISIDNQAGGLIRAGGAPTVALPNGYSPIATAPEGGSTVAIFATGKTIAITNSGTIQGGAGTTPGANVVFDSLDVYGGYIAGAIQTAGDEYETEDGEVYIASVDHVTNTASGTIVGSIDLGGNDDRLVNAGSITGNVFLRDGDDVLELHTSSIIDGTVDLGAGTDEVRLAGTGPNLGHVAATVNAELLDVFSGSWLADGAQSDYGLIRIAQAARLIVGENADGDTGVSTSHIELAGRLDLDFAEDTLPGDLTGLVIEGAGSLHVTGTGTLMVDDATGLQHTGGTFVDNGELLLTTEFGGDVTTTGAGVFELGAGGDFTGDLVNNGTFVFSREDDYSFTGDFSGTGALQKYGAGTLAFQGLYAFVGTTEIHAGLVKFTGQLAEDTEVDLDDGGVLDLSEIQGGEQTIAQLEGAGGTLQLGETNLVVDQGGNSVFAGEVVGSGTIQKEGEGDLKLEGDGTGFTGTGEVGGGTLSVNGDFSNANFEVNQGGTLGGRGTVGETNINGGTLAPGNSIDTLTVNGNVAFTSASVFEVEVNAAGQGDRVNATGTADLGGARVQVIAENGTYRPMTDYTILTAAGGLGGTRFGSVTDNLAFLDPSLIYSANAVTLRLVRNDIDFAAFGATPNQAAIGGLIESFGYGNTLYNETLLLADGSVAPSFASLTGEVYPTHSAALVETAEMLRRQTADAAPNTEGAFLWATGLYNTVEGGNMDLDGHGVAGGFGYGAGGFTASAGLGLLDQGDGGSDYLDGDLTFAVAHVGYDWMSGLSVSAGVQFGWADAVTRRQTALGTINRTVSGEIDGDYLQLFGEVGYSLPVGGGLQVEPFVGISHVSVDLDALTESGAATALAVSAIERDVTFADLGLRLSGEVGSGVRPFASAAYRHASGDRASLATVGFAGSAASALIGALPVAKSAAELSAGLVVTSGAVDFEVGYDGTISDTFDSHGVNAGIRIRF